MADRKTKTHRLALVLGAALTFLAASCAGNDGGTMDDVTPADMTGTQTCPPWVEFPADRHGNADSPYLGCVNHFNLVNMLESPADLDQGRPLGSESGERETAVLQDYDENKGSTFKNANAPNPAPAMSVTPAPAGGGGP